METSSDRDNFTPTFLNSAFYLWAYEDSALSIFLWVLGLIYVHVRKYSFFLDFYRLED